MLKSHTILVPRTRSRIKPVTRSRYNPITHRTEWSYSTEIVYETVYETQIVYDPPDPLFHNYSGSSSLYNYSSDKKDDKKEEVPVRPYIPPTPPKPLTPEEKEKLAKEEEERKQKREEYARNEKRIRNIGLISFIACIAVSVFSLIYELIFGETAILYILAAASLISMFSLHWNAFQDTDEVWCCCFYTMYACVILLMLPGLFWTQQLVIDNLAIGIIYIVLEYGAFIVWNYALFKYRFNYAKTEF
ncbi:MAG: hypothetical protein MJ252_21985 [archaeon]|nr:hypothetical protein [archaeon]